MVAADLARDGVTTEQLLDSGLMRRDDETGRVFDLFFNRVMFPIRDRRGRAISFGGRTMGDGQPKYLNGPETPLFSKRRTLYGIDLAREAARRGGTIVVVEGYMDVIALGQAGFDGAIAPLGTALTEEQFSELWRLSPAPVLCFDGDAAGARAAARAVELALPMLKPERTLHLIALPSGEDPDSLVRSQGARVFRSMLDGARPLAECLFDILREGVGDTTPEQRAALRTRLDEAARRIPDKALAAEYRGVLLDRFFANRRQGHAGSRSAGRSLSNRSRPTKALPTRTHPRPSADALGIAAERTRILTAILLRHPMLLRGVRHAYAGLRLDPVLARMRESLSEWAKHAEILDSRALMDHLDAFGLRADAERVLGGAPVPLPACASSAASLAEAEEGWWHIFGFLNVDRLREEIVMAREDAARGLTEETVRRLVALTSAFNKVRAGEPDGADLA